MQKHSFCGEMNKLKHWKDDDFICVEKIFNKNSIIGDWANVGDYLLIKGSLPGKIPNDRYIWLWFRNQSDGFICTSNMIDEMKYKVIKKDDIIEYAKALLLWRDK